MLGFVRRNDIGNGWIRNAFHDIDSIAFSLTRNCSLVKIQTCAQLYNIKKQWLFCISRIIYKLIN